jgi:peptidoglycan/LPS O-acetylase OafA/YrhL
VWQVAFLAAFAIIYGLHDARVSMSGTLLAATLYNTFKRLVWALSLGWVIFACVKGYGGPVNDFLSWSVFAPLSRLTYCSFLFHMSIIYIFSSSVLSTFPNDFRQAVQYLFSARLLLDKPAAQKYALYATEIKFKNNFFLELAR